MPRVPADTGGLPGSRGLSAPNALTLSHPRHPNPGAAHGSPGSRGAVPGRFRRQPTAGAAALPYTMLESSPYPESKAFFFFFLIVPYREKANKK